MYIRIGRDPVPRFVPEGYKFQLGKSLTPRDVFGKSGSNEAMKEKFGLRSVDIAREAENILKR